MLSFACLYFQVGQIFGSGNTLNELFKLSLKAMM